MSLNRRVNNQDITYFLDLKRNGQLDLDPPFQRKSVWTIKDRRYFLDTIFRGYPCPSIYLSKDVKNDGTSVYSVVDGKQRLETIVMFSEDKIVLRGYGDTSIDGRTWSEIRTNRELSRRFLDYVLPVEQLTIGDDLNEVFDRLNRNNKNLNRQELRHAKYDGWFIEFVESETKDPIWQELGIVTAARARRMLDVQFLSELLIVTISRDIQGFDQNTIDEFTARYQDGLDEITFERSPEEITTEFHSVKRHLHQLVTTTENVISHTRKFVHLYSLWALLCLEVEQPLPSTFAHHYAEFLEQASEIQDRMDLPGEETTKPVWNYSFNSIGASTELPQRRARHDILKTLLTE